MGLADTANLIVDLSLKGNFSSQLAANRRALTGFDKQITSTQGRAYKAGTQIGVGIKRGALLAAGAIGFLGSQVVVGLNQLAQLEDATTATNAALKSTKNVAGQTAASIRNLAEKYEALNATIDDKVIQSGENVLLTFTNIRKQAFEPALKAALDLSVGMKQDLQTSIVQIGKALNDPIKGLTSLSRIGVAFSAGQKKQIADLVKHNDLLGAQKIILAELSKEFGGRFAAAGKTAKGTIAGIGDAVEDLQKALATALFPTVQKILPKIRAALADPKVVATIEGLGKSIADLFSDANIAEGGRILGTVFDTAKAAAPVLKDAAVATLGVVKAAVSLFRSLPPEIQKLAVGAFAINKITGGLVTNIAGGLISAVISSFKGLMNVNAGVVNVNGPAGGVAGAAGAAGKGRVASVASAAAKVFLVGAAIGVFAELKGILDEQSGRNKVQAAGNAQQTAVYVKSASFEDMKTSLSGIDGDIARLSHGFDAQNLAFQFNIDGVRDSVLATRAALVKAIADEKARLVDASTRTKDDVVRAVTYGAGSVRDKIESAKIAQVSKLNAVQRAAKYAGQQAAAAIKDKDLSIGVTIPVNVTATVTNRESSHASATFSRVFNNNLDRRPT